MTRARGSIALGLVALLALAACAPTPHKPAPGLESTVLERDRIASEAHENNVARAAAFLRDKWGPVPLPELAVDRWVAADQWAPTIVDCLADAGFPGVRSADGGERLDYSGIRTIDPRVLFEIDVASYTCQAKFPVREWFADDVRAIEAPWALTYTRDVLVPCLLAAGFEVPPVPSTDEFARTWRTEAQFDSYGLIAGSPATVARARSDCPPPDVVLDGAA
jgi:hypothetical protein